MHQKTFSGRARWSISKILQGIRNFFVGRSHQSKIDNCFFDIGELLSGVVQGCGIGPLMFYCTLLNWLVYLNAMVSE